MCQEGGRTSRLEGVNFLARNTTRPSVPCRVRNQASSLCEDLGIEARAKSPDPPRPQQWGVHQMVGWRGLLEGHGMASVRLSLLGSQKVVSVVPWFLMSGHHAHPRSHAGGRRASQAHSFTRNASALDHGRWRAGHLRGRDSSMPERA